MTKIILPTDETYRATNCIQFQEPAVLSFDTVTEQLNELFDCSYISYALEIGGNKRIHYYSNKEWQEVFLNDRLIEHCPLLHWGKKTMEAIVPWHVVSGQLNKKQKAVMAARKEFNIGNGVALRQYFSGFNEVVTLASDYENHDFLKTLFADGALLKKYIFDLRTIAFVSAMQEQLVTLHPRFPFQYIIQ